MWLNAGWAVALVPALWIGARLDGIEGRRLPTASSGCSSPLPLAVLALHRAGVSLIPTLPALVRPLIGAATMASVILLIESVLDGNAFIHLLLAGGTGLIVYILVVVPLHNFRRVTALRDPLPVIDKGVQMRDTKSLSRSDYRSATAPTESNT